MAVPKKKKSKSRSGHNNSHNALKIVDLAFDTDGYLHRSHVATKLPDGSFKYKGMTVLPAKVKKEKAEGTNGK